ncbi:MAG: tetratricopeptide repeat protein [Lentisphaeria bacterium]|nr:tetratricopeptide repeat protein [Lentisphaeria bacterium]
MKQIIFTVLFFAAALAMAAGIEVSVDRDSVPENEPFNFFMNIDGNMDNRLTLPPLKDGRWLTNRRQDQFSVTDDGRTTRVVGIGIVGTGPGKLVIPPFKVKIDGQELMTKQLEVNVVPLSEMAVNDGAGESVILKNAIFGEFTIPNERPSYFVGEAIPVSISVFALESLRPQLIQLPTLTGVDNMVLRSYRWRDGQSASFSEPISRLAIHDGRRYIKFDFNTVLRPLKPGRVEPQASLTMNIAEEGQRGSRRSFGFSFLFNDLDYKPYKLTLSSPAPFEVKPLPPAPKGAVNLGLVGDWKLTGGFDRNLAKMGEALTFFLKLEGSGTADTLSAPKLSFENMRVFPPEVQKSDNDIRIRYAVVPLKEGEFKQELKLATFDTGTGKYVIHNLDLKLPVEKSDLPLTPGYSADDTAFPAPAEPAVQPGKRPAVRHTHRTQPGSGVRLPLMLNALPAAIAIVLGAGIAALLIELAARRRHRMMYDPEYRRARLLKRETPKLVAKLKAARSEAELLKLLSESVHPLLAEALRLPPGATPSEIVAKIEDPELRKFLESGIAAEFMPAAARKNLFSPENIELLVREIRKYAALLLLAFLMLPAIAAEPAQPDPFTRGGEAFAAGNYKTALDEYRRILNDRSPSPHVLYNLGEAAYRLGDLPLAKGYFERAHRLAPRDPVIAEDLRQVDESLKLPQDGSTRFNRYRDWLRPDHYLLAGAVALAVLMLAAALRRKLPPVLARITFAAAAALVILSAAAVYFQLNGTYHPERAIVLGQTLELRSLPAAASGSVVATVPGGSDARILDRNGGFVRISVNGQDGWVPAGKIMPLY